MTAATRQKLFEKIAFQHMNIQTLQTRNSDELDFHDVSVWGAASALEAAYAAGVEAERNRQRRKRSRT